VLIVMTLMDRYKKIPLPAKASLWFVFCNVLQRGISLFTVPLFTRLLTTEQYGIYSTYLSWYQVLLIFTSFNLYYGVFNNAMIKYKNQRARYISSMQGLVIILTVTFFVIYLCLKDFFNSLLDMTTPLILLLFIHLLFAPFMEFWTVHKRFDYKYKIVIIITLIKSILNPILGIIFVLHSEHKDFARIVSVVLVEVCVCGIVGIYQFIKGKCFFDRKFWKTAIMFNLPLIPHYLSGSILSQSDRIIISKMVGSSEVAFYSVSYNIGMLINIIVTAVNSSLTPWMYKKIKDNKSSDIKNVVNMLLLLMGILIILLIFFAPEVLYIIASKEYAEAVYVIPPVAASTFFYFMYNIFANIEFYYEKRIFVFIGSIAAAVLNIVLNCIFIPRLGYYAAGYTTLVCYIIYGLSHLGFSKLVISKKLGKVEIFETSYILGASAVIIILTIALNFLYSNTLLRYTILVITLLIVFAKRKMFMKTVKGFDFIKR
jgi:O-antigen/teichoic acid export membrane protein